MILLYTVFVLLLGLIKLLVSMRTRALERKFTRVAAAVSQLLREPAKQTAHLAMNFGRGRQSC